MRATYLETTSDPATHTWRIDTTPPQTTLTEVETTASQLRASLSSERDARFQCKVVKPGSSGKWASCESVVTVALAGVSSVEFRAVDLAGNVDPTPARWVPSGR